MTGVTGDYKDRYNKLTSDFVKNATLGHNEWDASMGKLKDSITPTALSAPVNVTFGNFAMPFTTGTQKNAQALYGNITDKALTNQNQLGQDIYDARQTRADNFYKADATLGDLINRLKLGNADFSQDLNQQTFDKQGALANLIFQGENALPPNMAEDAWYQELKGINEANENRRYGLPTQSESANVGVGQALAQGVGDAAQMYLLASLYNRNNGTLETQQPASSNLDYGMFGGNNSYGLPTDNASYGLFDFFK